MTDIHRCTSCIHYNPFKERTCKAFPTKIPSDIFTGKRKHIKVLKAQTGKHTFKERPDPFAVKSNYVTLSQFSKSSCIKCDHFMVDFGICPAFPNGIPLEILRGNDLHLEPVEGQNTDLIFKSGKNSI